MTWRRAFFSSVLAVAMFAGAAPVTVWTSAAAPGGEFPAEPPGVGDQGCSFTLSPPQFVEIPGGGRAVTATMTPNGCTGVTQPTSTTVCVSTPQGTSDCASASAWIPAQVIVAASPLSGTFKATGTGCTHVATPAADFCVPSGPVYTTL